MRTKIHRLLWLFILLVLVCASLATQTEIVNALPTGFITFEDGVDKIPIESSIPGLTFTTTDGYPWIYGDWRTGFYNGPYPLGLYTSNGNFFAWLGPSQGDGRIDFTEGGATYFSVWASCAEPVTLRGYDEYGVLDEVTIQPNVGTGQMTNMTVTAPSPSKFTYIIISGVANYWLIDDLSTDADGVPDTRNPIVFVPGLAGSSMENDHNQDGNYDEVWPNTDQLWWSPDDSFLNVLRLDEDGNQPDLNIPEYTTVRVGHVLSREALIIDVYESTINFFTDPSQGYELGEDFILCPYDWRKDLEYIAYGNPEFPNAPSLEKCINLALEKNPEATKVNILAHSMGGLVTRYYMSDTEKANKVEKLVTLGSPLLGAPKITLGLVDSICFTEIGPLCFTNEQLLHELVQNFPSGYQISPGDEYFSVYPDGYYRIDWDKDGDGVNDDWLDQEEAFQIIRAHNEDLADRARTVYDSAGSWSNGSGTNGVQVFSIVGDGLDTLGVIVEEYRRPWWNPWGDEELVYVPENVAGDGTVPLRSADTRNLAAGVDLTGDAIVYYFNYSHGDLAKEPDVLQFAATLFANETSSISSQSHTSAPSGSNTNGIMKLPDDTQEKGDMITYNGLFELPRTTPLPLNVRRIEMYGPIQVEIFNNAGDRTGALENGGWENNIPGVVFTQIGDFTVIGLPEGDVYNINILGYDEGKTDLRITTITSDEVAQAEVYNDMPFTNETSAFMTYDPLEGTAGSFNMDYDSDGIVDELFPPTAILDPAASLDYIAPTTNILLEGQKSPEGWYVGEVTVTMTATDNPGGTGVASIQYTTDGGKTEFIYTSPFIVEADLVSIIMAKATDFAGNEEATLAQILAGPLKVFLPFMVSR